MIDPLERRALDELRRLDWAPTQDDVWSRLDFHIDGLNGDVGAAVLRTYETAASSTGRNPVGLVIQGQHGSGKTHLIRWARERVQLRGGYFFLMGIADGRSFWPNVVSALLRGLHRPGSYRHPQLAVLLERLAKIAGVSNDLRLRVRGANQLTPEALDQFISAFRRAAPEVGRECRHTLRALTMLASSEEHANDLAENWLTSAQEETAIGLERWGVPTTVKQPQEVAGELSRLVACTGAALFAVDQIDPVFAQARTSTVEDGSGRGANEPIALAADLGEGLMQLREVLSRTVTVVACLPGSWGLIEQNAVASVSGRFRKETRLARIPSAEIATELVTARFEPYFETAEFPPPYPTWPVVPEAFRGALGFTPRGLLQRVDEHVRACLEADEVVPLTDLDQAKRVPTRYVPAPPRGRLEMLDGRLAALRDEVVVDGALAPATEDREMSRLLLAGLQAWTIEQGEKRARYSVQRGEDGNPSMHAWLRESLDEETEDEAHWSFRALSHPNAIAVQARLRRLLSFVNLDPAISKRRAIVLRNPTWPTGKVSQRVKQDYLDRGGMLTTVSTDDLRTFAALAAMLNEHDPALPDWLLARRPAGNTALFGKVFGPPPDDGEPQKPQPDATGGPTGSTSEPEPALAPERAGPSLDLGTMTETGEPVRAPLESLRKHAVIFAGSGSGKTVLIRRLIEECALNGVSAIVLDPNNDLARLGDPWPEPPRTWRPGDADLAATYLEGTDVVVWTPRRTSGRPVSFQPLPDFAAVLDEPDEFGLALDTAVAALAPRARMAGNTAKADRGRAVLRQALDYFARTRNGDLSRFVDLLSDLPEGAASLSRAHQLAADMAETLRAAMVNDPMFGGEGETLDPAVLLKPAPGKRARISVISLIGLPNDEHRQSFVNQLQMALFAWIKRHPAGDRPLGGLFVMDEAQTFVPSGPLTACTESTLALASQARKYGLGLIFATQAPKGIHNRIIGNAATQFYGFLNSPVQIAAAREVASAKGTTALEISRLEAGQFYTVGEGTPFRKLAVPMCLSYHPATALSAEEVLARART
ncbi:ATP-binding protein [Asanoa siamensis]|uniref:ATPase n=1 Tax=Asanoa siamensis TaxID=926357 RepID=A0ABQ4CYB5_9ACTN|nr:ATP-binding protein [Asanoa siamensis]GIF75817.1 ATPase [Asanoa siamensis]